MNEKEPAESRGGDGVQVLSRAADILRTLHAAPAGLTQAEVAGRLGLARTTVYRILNALEAEGLVATDRPRGRYRLGPEIARLAEAGRRAVVATIHPFLVELSRHVDETVDLSVLEHSQATFVDQIVANHRLRAVSAVGESFPLHCTANGKAFLATMHPLVVRATLPASLPALTPRTITSLADLHAELDHVASTGVAYDREEHTSGICAVGAVVHGLPGGLVSVSVPMPAQRFYGRESELAAALMEYVCRIEQVLGS